MCGKQRTIWPYLHIIRRIATARLCRRRLTLSPCARRLTVRRSGPNQFLRTPSMRSVLWDPETLQSTADNTPAKSDTNCCRHKEAQKGQVYFKPSKLLAPKMTCRLDRTGWWCVVFAPHGTMEDSRWSHEAPSDTTVRLKGSKCPPSHSRWQL
eukprot:6488669-Amphidinium_carterae.1